MRLHPEVRTLFIEPANHRELFGARGRRKSRRQGVAEPVPAVPALDEVAAIRFRARHIVAQIVRGVAVHQDLAAEHAQLARLRFLEERIDRLLMNGGIDGGRGGAVAQQRIQEQGSDPARMIRVRKSALGRKGVVVQPIQQLPPIGGDDVDLRVMHVGVDEARHDQLAAMVIQRIPRLPRL